MPKFLVTYRPGQMAQDPDSVAAARRALVRWAGGIGHALVDAGEPVRSATSLSRDGTRDVDPVDQLLGWSVIDAADRHAAVRLLQDHPFVALGALLQISEPV